MAEQMKPSGIDWIGDVPNEWDITKVKYRTSQIGSGTTPDSGNPLYYEDGCFPWIQSGDLYNADYIRDTEKKITELAVADFNALTWYEKEFVVVAMYGASVGNIAISQISSYTNQACCVLKAKDDDLRYLFYFLSAGKENMLQMAFGGTQPNISQAIIKNLPYLDAPHNEQQAIANFLDKECAQIDSIAADLEKQIALLQQYKKSLITETVTKGLDKSVPMKDSGVEFFGKIPAHWKVSKTKYVADISIGLVTTMTANYVDEDGVPLIRNSNIRTNHIDDNGMVYLSKEFAKANIGRALHKGDIVTVHTGDVGTSAIINGTYHMSHGFATIISRLKTKTVNNQFLCWLYNSEIFKEMSIAYSTGDGRQNLNLYDFVDFYILIPTLKEQMEIVNWLNLKCTEIDNFIENKQQQLLLIQQHKKSLIYEYVTGKKRVKEVR